MGSESQGDGLGEYRRKRDFSRTTEPEGQAAEGPAGIFVVQKHSARSLHYDFRLELHGTLKSWAVPKGPSLNPEDKRLAVHVEDHPLEYAGFEGVIPRGEYGGGAVIVWDKGFWLPEEDPDRGLQKGAMKFILSGKKLRGRWALVRLKPGERDREEKDEWLLIKEEDADSEVTGDVTIERPESVISGRSVEEVATLPEGVWSGKENETRILPSEARYQKKPMPEMMRPALATLVDAPPSGGGWVHELKYDGYRILAEIREESVRLITRNGNDWTDRFQSIAGALSRLFLKEAWLDGEVVAIGEEGITSFEGLQHALAMRTDEGLIYMLFDVLYYNGYSLMEAPLYERKLLAESILKSERADSRLLRFSGHVEGKGPEFFEHACTYRIEGIISKKRDSSYVEGRSRSWLKTKCLLRDEFVIGGYTEPGGERKSGFGALLIGAYDRDGNLIYCGRVGTGFNERSISEVWERLKPLETAAPPFQDPPTGAEAKGVHWVRPELVAEVEYRQRTAEGVLRHASFQGLREDKPAREVVAEDPLRAKEAVGPTEERLAPSPPADPGPVRVIKSVRVTNPGRVFYPEKGYTKADLIGYYEAVAPLMLPHLAGRPLTLVRCPEGVGKECFYQKHSVNAMPPELKRLAIAENDGTQAEYLMVDTPEGLMALAQIGALEIHTWDSRYVKVEHPDRLVFDIDPDEGVGWERLVEAVFLMRALLEELGLKSFVKATGGKGLHVVVPVLPIRDWEEIQGFTRAVAEFVARGLPDRFTSMMTKSRRTGRIFIDYMRNIRGATAIEAYSTRAKPGAPIAAPLGWDELMLYGPGSFTLANMKDRIRDAGNPWDGYMDIKQPVTIEMEEKMGLRR
ncbi:MAG: DNA ligase D [Thermodesulfobacteriota bacterium]|nr:MAG: DNA ligase D [Thermodesulfobacteriota bacterium]